MRVFFNFLAFFVASGIANGQEVRLDNNTAVLAVHRTYGKLISKDKLGYLDKVLTGEGNFVSCDQKITEKIKSSDFKPIEFKCEDLPEQGPPPIGIVQKFHFNQDNNTYSIVDSAGNAAGTVKCADVPPQFIWGAIAASSAEDAGIVLTKEQLEAVTTAVDMVLIDKNINVVNNNKDIISVTDCVQAGSFVLSKPNFNTEEWFELDKALMGTKLGEIIDKGSVASVFREVR